VEFRFAERHQSCLREKQAIAREAAEQVVAGQCILLDTGTTTLEVAQAIRHIDDLRVVTTSLAVAATLYAQANIELILLGGTVRQTSPDLSGPLTEENLAGFRVDTAFLGADGAGREGLYTDSLAVGRLSRGMIACAGRVILVVDHTKFAHRAFRRYACWDDIDTLITDDAVPQDTREWLSDAGVCMCCASVG
jgi:DeoR/GlpR family transcriptional regulator of sugar metabolism